MWLLWTLLLILAITVIYDLVQPRHAILRNFPVIGHFRYWLEAIGPELRQYIVTGNDEERPFSRDQRRWIYASSKNENNYFGFGTDNDLEATPNYLIIKHSAFPVTSPHPDDPGYDSAYTIRCAKILGQARDRKMKFRPESVVNISAMSFGSLSSRAVEALNRGAALCGCLHNTGEGGVSPYHLNGGDLIWQIGTGYFGCRASDGGFDLDRFRETVAHGAIRAIEIKLSQGAKPGLGGLLPGAKVTDEIAQIRGITPGKDLRQSRLPQRLLGCRQPARFCRAPGSRVRPSGWYQIGRRRSWLLARSGGFDGQWRARRRLHHCRRRRGRDGGRSAGIHRPRCTAVQDRLQSGLQYFLRTRSGQANSFHRIREARASRVTASSPSVWAVT